MGWTFQHEERGTRAVDIFRRDLLNPGEEVVAFGSDGSTCYVATRLPDGTVRADVMLTQRRSRDYYNFGYKTVPETWGPMEDRCPAKVLDALTPTDDAFAMQWRAKCRANLDRIAAVHEGSIVRIDRYVLQAVDLKRGLFRSQYGNRLTRVPWWRDAATVLPGWPEEEFR